MTVLKIGHIQTKGKFHYEAEYLYLRNYRVQRVVLQEIDRLIISIPFLIDNHTRLEDKNDTQIVQTTGDEELAMFSHFLIDQCPELSHGTQWKRIQNHYLRRLQFQYLKFLKYLLFTVQKIPKDQLKSDNSDEKNIILNFLHMAKKLITHQEKQRNNKNSSIEKLKIAQDQVKQILNKMAKFNQQYDKIFGFKTQIIKQVKNISIFIQRILKQSLFLTDLTLFIENIQYLLQEEKQKKIQQRLIKNAKTCSADLILYFVSKQKQKKQTCLNCQNKINISEMQTHIKLCRSLFACYQQIQEIDAQIHGKIQDLNALLASIRHLKQQKTRQIQFMKKPKTYSKFNNKFSKSLYDSRNTSEFLLSLNKKISEESDEESIFDQNTFRPCLKDLSIEQLNKYLEIIEDIKRFAARTKNHKKQLANLNIYIEIKEFKRQLKQNSDNLQSKQVTSSIKAIIRKLKIMHKLKQIDSKMSKNSSHQKNSCFQSEYEQLNSQKSQLGIKEKISEGQAYSDDQSISISASQQVNDICLKDFKLIRVLGQGKYGEVLLVKKIKTGVKYAMKRIKLKYIDNQNQIQKLRNQNNTFSIVNSQFLVKAVFSFTQGKYHYFIMEYAPNGDFADRLMQEQRLYEYEAKPLLAEMAVAINSLHEAGIIHRDIKPQNIVIDSEGHLKLTDYGLSETQQLQKKKFQKKTKGYSNFVKQQLTNKQSKKSNRHVRDKIVGSPYYMAPEVLSFEPLTRMSDWWSFGILVYQTLVGEPPFLGKNFEEISNKIIEGNIWWTDEIVFGEDDSMISYQAKDLIQLLLTYNPDKRLGQKFEDIKSHSFFSGIQWQNLRNTPSPIEVPLYQQQSDEESTFSDQTFHSYGSTSPDLKLIRRDILLKETKVNYYKHIACVTRLRRIAQSLKNQV